MVDRLKRLLGDQKLSCIDVGARGGVQRTWQPYASLLEVDAFEPDPVACAKENNAKRPGEHWHAVGLGERTGKAQLHVLKKASSSSLYPPNLDIMRHYTPEFIGEGSTPVEIDVVSLGEFLASSPRPRPNLMKLDVQGGELPILRSMQDGQWEGMLGLQTEISFVPFYSGQPLFWDVDAHIRQHGLMLFDILPVRLYRVKGGQERHFLKKHLNIRSNRPDISRRLVTGDALFLRDPASVLATGDRIQIVKLLVVLLIHRFLDEALWLLEESCERRILTAEEAGGIVTYIRSVAPRPTLLQRNDRLGRIARKLSKKLNIGRARKIEFWLDRSWDY